jgi:hypothetical protein
MATPILSLSEGDRSASDSHAVAEPIGALRDLQTRFLYPFFFDRYRAAEAVAALAGQTCPNRDGRGHALWHCERPSSLYCDELLNHAQEFLFGKASGADEAAATSSATHAKANHDRADCADGLACRYLKISADVAFQSDRPRRSVPMCDRECDRQSKSASGDPRVRVAA